MSGWDSWLAHLKADSQANACADSCGIFDLAGNPWTATPGFSIGATGAQEVQKAISGGAGVQSRVNLNGQKYMVLQNDIDMGIVVGKLNQGGFCAVKGKQCLVVSVYNDSNTVSPGNNRKQIEFVRSELIEKMGY